MYSGEKKRRTYLLNKIMEFKETKIKKPRTRKQETLGQSLYKVAFIHSLSGFWEQIFGS